MSLLTLPQIPDMPGFAQTVEQAGMGITPVSRARAAARIREALLAGKIRPDRLTSAIQDGDKGVAALVVRNKPRLPRPTIGGNCFTEVRGHDRLTPEQASAVKDLIAMLSKEGDLDEGGCGAIAQNPCKSRVLTVLSAAWERYCRRIVSPITDMIPAFLMESGDSGVKTFSPHCPFLILPTALVELLGLNYGELQRQAEYRQTLVVINDPFIAFLLPDWRIEPDNQWALTAVLELLRKSIDRDLLFTEDIALPMLGWEIELLQDACLTAEWVDDRPIIQPEMLDVLDSELGYDEQYLTSEALVEQMRYLRWCEAHHRAVGKPTIKAVQKWCQSHKESLLFPLVNDLLALVKVARKLGLAKSANISVELCEEDGVISYQPFRDGANLEQTLDSAWNSYFSNTAEAAVLVSVREDTDAGDEIRAWLLGAAIAQLALKLTSHAAKSLRNFVVPPPASR